MDYVSKIISIKPLETEGGTVLSHPELCRLIASTSSNMLIKYIMFPKSVGHGDE